MIVGHEILKGTLTLQYMIFVTDNLQSERSCSICGKVFLSKFLFAIHPNFRDSKQTQIISDDSPTQNDLREMNVSFVPKICVWGACQTNHVTGQRLNSKVIHVCLWLYIYRKNLQMWSGPFESPTDIRALNIYVCGFVCMCLCV